MIKVKNEYNVPMTLAESLDKLIMVPECESEPSGLEDASLVMTDDLFYLINSAYDDTSSHNALVLSKTLMNSEEDEKYISIKAKK